MLIDPHNAGGPLSLAASLTADSAMSNFLIQEMNVVWFQSFDLYVEHDWNIVGGYINFSNRPGLGVDVKEADIEDLPYELMPYRQYRHEDDIWKGW